jgi:Ca-activated chloride channel family protein
VGFDARVIAVGVAAAALGGPLQTPAQRKPFQSGVEVIAVAATVRDSDGRLVNGLPREAFEVYDDGQRQAVTQFTNERVALSLGVLIDVSDSMFGQRIKDARAAVDRFLFDLLDSSDEFFILAFNHEPRFLTGWTSSPAAVRDALDALRPWGGTAEYDAVLAALPFFAKRTKPRAALLLITDGADTASDAKLRDVRSVMLQSDAFTFAIAIDPPDRVAINTRVNVVALRDVTDNGGGWTEVARNAEELVEATANIADELNHQYLIGYNGPHKPDGQFHSIRVAVRGGEYRVRARKGYVATPLPAKK